MHEGSGCRFSGHGTDPGEQSTHEAPPVVRLTHTESIATEKEQTVPNAEEEGKKKILQNKLERQHKINVS